MTSKKLTVVLPAYNEEGNVKRSYDVINGILNDNKIPHDFVYVNDGSKDNTWSEIEKLAKTKNNVRGIKFSRNFGKEAAVYAGLEHSNVEGCVVVLDIDLQHPPIKIVEMYDKWLEGYEIVEGVKASRGNESIINKVGAKVFYDLISGATGFDMRHASDFKLLDKKAVITLLNIKEKNAFFRALSSWIGYKTTTVEFNVEERVEGESKWSTKSLIKYAINNVTSFSSAPMQIITGLGVCTFVVSIIFGLIALFDKFAGRAVEGMTTVTILLLLSSSVIMLSLGIIGFYISKIYDEVKGRPRYIVSEVKESKKKNERVKK